MEKRKNIKIIAQAFYGNRTFTEISPDKMDLFILGYLGDVYCESDKEKGVKGRTVVPVPGTDGIVIVYNCIEEQEVLDEMSRKVKSRFEHARDRDTERHVRKPLAEIPEIGLKLYSRCIVCRMSPEGEFESLRPEDSTAFMKYLAR